MQSPAHAARLLTGFLKRVDPQLSDASDSTLSILSDPIEATYLSRLPADQLQNMISQLQGLASALNTKGKVNSKQVDSREWEIMLQYVRLLIQNCEYTLSNGYGGIRDSAMAENVRWILGFEGKGSRIVIWAHNQHIASTSDMSGAKSMGEWLSEEFPSSTVSFALLFNRGGFKAIEYAFPSTGLHQFQVPPAPQGTLDATLAAAGLPLAVVNLRELPSDGPVDRYFSLPQKSRSIGAFYTDRFQISYLLPQAFAKEYTAILFVDSTTPAQTLPAGMRSNPGLLHNPSNLDFEVGGVSGKPVDWQVAEGLAGLDYQIDVSNLEPHGGEYCACIRRKSGISYGESFGNLYQRIDASPFRGGHVTLHAFARVSSGMSASRGFLWMSVGRYVAGPTSIVSFQKRLIQSDRWQEYTVETNVGQDANTLSYGILYAGEGEVWVDDVALESAGEGNLHSNLLRLARGALSVLACVASLLLAGKYVCRFFHLPAIERRLSLSMPWLGVPVLIAGIVSLMAGLQWATVVGTLPYLAFSLAVLIREFPIAVARSILYSTMLIPTLEWFGTIGLVAVAFMMSTFLGLASTAFVAFAVAMALRRKEFKIRKIARRGI